MESFDFLLDKALDKYGANRLVARIAIKVGGLNEALYTFDHDTHTSTPPVII